VFNALGEPTLQSLGIGSNWPPGLVQQLLEIIHVDLGLEWYQAIVLFTVALRLCLLPVNVLAQRSATKMRKISPQMMHYQEKLSDAKARGNTLEGDIFNL
jgi:YidC/Oxa1 family membrane protein insertase